VYTRKAAINISPNLDNLKKLWHASLRCSTEAEVLFVKNLYIQGRGESPSFKYPGSLEPGFFVQKVQMERFNPGFLG
jgi:hypothetical protein